ncbi:MAG: molybdenum cofactor cytidylyltransferase, partial [Paracoccaceae bacterium]
MKFGPVLLGDAKGAILAHSVRVEGARLRKGLTLDADHIEKLTAAGLSEVIVAR